MSEMPVERSDTADTVYRLQTSLISSSTDGVESATQSFRQRQNDVFACLADLEQAHKEVTKSTKEERKAIQKATWRRAIAAPEDLVAEKERREHNRPTEEEPTQIEHGHQLSSSEFRRPMAPRPLAAVGRVRKETSRDPAKWTHYSLADVDEDGYSPAPDGSQSASRDPNFSIALSFFAELRGRRQEAESSEDHADEDKPTSRRILFRPTRGTKRVRRDETEDEQSSKSATTSVSGLEHGDEELEHRVRVLEDCSSDSVGGSSTFIHRQQRGRFRSRVTTNDQQEDEQNSQEADGACDEGNCGAAEESMSEEEVELEGEVENDLVEDFLA